MSARDASKLSFSSDFRYERVSLRGNRTFSVPSFGVTTLTIPHNLGYRPYFEAFYTYQNGKIYPFFAGPASYGIDGNTGQADNAYTDATNLYLSMAEGSGAGTITGTVYYRIYEEQVT